MVQDSGDSCNMTTVCCLKTFVSAKVCVSLHSLFLTNVNWKELAIIAFV